MSVVFVKSRTHLITGTRQECHHNSRIVWSIQLDLCSIDMCLTSTCIPMFTKARILASEWARFGCILKSRSPGYGLTLVAQTSSLATHSAECLSVSGTTSTPEDIALQAARSLLEEVENGGCVDSKHQWLVLLLMTLGKEDVGRCLMGGLTSHTLVRNITSSDFTGYNIYGILTSSSECDLK